MKPILNPLLCPPPERGGLGCGFRIGVVDWDWAALVQPGLNHVPLHVVLMNTGSASFVQAHTWTHSTYIFKGPSHCMRVPDRFCPVAWANSSLGLRHLGPTKPLAGDPLCWIQRIPAAARCQLPFPSFQQAWKLTEARLSISR